MSGFYMLAGSLMGEQTLESLQQSLRLSGIDSELDAEQGELTLALEAVITVREGFQHECIVVGDAAEETLLLSALERFTNWLDEQGIAFEFELYDRYNRLFHQVSALP